MQRNATKLMLMSALLCGAFGFCGGVSSQLERNDPDRLKTPADSAAIEAAQRKRERKRERKAALASKPNA